VREEPAEGPKTGQAGSWNLGLALSTAIPFSSPFEISGTAIPTASFRFQLPVTAAIGLLYGWTDRFDVGVELGLESYGSKVQISPSTQDLQIVEMTAYPVRALFRYRFGQSETFVPELELGAGYATGKARISSTIVGSKSFEENVGYLTGHASGGVAVAWNDETTLHAQAGASYSGLSAKKYADPATAATTSQKAILGLFVRAGLSYRF